jgi:hypothetical protein
MVVAIGPAHAGGSDEARVAEIVPDGVARVRWIYPLDGASPHRNRTFAVRGTPALDNVAVAPATPHQVAPQRATWLSADGAVVPTSSAAARRDAAAVRRHASRRQRRESRSDIRRLKATSVKAPTTILQGFAVFSGGGRFARDGVTVTHPALSGVPFSVLGLMEHQESHGALDITQIREVSTGPRRQLFVIPGASGVCVAILQAAELGVSIIGNPATPTGATLACSDSVAGALSDGAGATGVIVGRFAYAAGVVPGDHPTTSVRRFASNKRRTIRPPLGVYFTRIAPVH